MRVAKVVKIANKDFTKVVNSCLILFLQIWHNCLEILYKLQKMKFNKIKSY